MKRIAQLALALLAGMLFATSSIAEQALVIKPLAEKKVAQLPAGELFWRIESFVEWSQAQAAETQWSLAVKADGKFWLFTLGAAGGSSPGASKVADVGPIARISAPEYLLRINDASGSPGSVTPVHTHPGSEAFFVLTGEQSIRGPSGTTRVAAGQAEAGKAADAPMQVSSTGSTDLHALVMFVVDATKPFSAPAVMQ